MEQKKKVEVLNDVLALINKCYQKDVSLQEQYRNCEILRSLGALMVYENSLPPKEEEALKEEE